MPYALPFEALLMLVTLVSCVLIVWGSRDRGDRR
jgi:hypothetical protein